MDGKRKTRTTSTRRGGRLARWVAALALGALAVVVFLPAFVTGQVNRILHGLMASGVAEFRLVHAGLFRSDVAIAFDDGGPEGPPLEVASCSLAYRPQSLLAGHIDAVSLGGVVLRVVATNGVVAIPAVEFFAPPAASAAPSRAFSLKRLRELPVTVDRVRLAGHIVAQIDGETLVIPVKAEAAIQNDAGWDAIDASLRLRFSTSAIDVAARCSPADESISAQVRARIAADGLPAVLRTRLPDALRCAAADVTAQATASFDGAALPHFAIEVQADAKAETERLAFALHPVLKAAGNRDRVDASLTGLAADVGGVRIALDATNVVASLAEQSLDGTLAIAIATNAPLALVFHASPCDFAVGFGEGGAPWSGGVAAEGFEVACEGLRLEARGTRDSATGEAAGGAVLALDGLAIRDAEGRLVAETGPGGITNAIAVSTKAGRLDIAASGGAGEIAMPSAESALREVAYAGRYAIDAAGAVTSAVSAAAAAVFRGVELARFEASLQQTPTHGYAVAGRIGALGMAGTLRGGLAFDAETGPSFDVAFDLPEQALDLAPIHALVPELAGYAIGGKLAASAEWHAAPDDQKGALKVRFSEGTLDNPAQGLSASDIRATFEMPYLPSLASNSQYFGFKNLKAGQFSVDSGMAVFRMQSPQVWFLDKLILDWCGGKVRAESTRIARANKNTWITLHADQLRLADLLHQFGIGSFVGDDPAEGGKLSGTIPMVISDGKVVVRDGYFHSAPGKTGRIRLLPAQRVLDMAGASIQTSLALDALGNFTYEWIRIVLNSEGEDLLLKFEMDGRPSNKLNYSVSGGEIVRSRNASKFEGLVLDTNFRIPLNALISIALPLAKPLGGGGDE